MKKDNIKPRDYVNQAKWEKNHYRRYVLSLTIKDSTTLDKILQNRNIGFTEWIKLKIKTDRFK